MIKFAAFIVLGFLVIPLGIVPALIIFFLVNLAIVLSHKRPYSER